MQAEEKSSSVTRVCKQCRQSIDCKGHQLFHMAAPLRHEACGYVWKRSPMPVHASFFYCTAIPYATGSGYGMKLHAGPGVRRPHVTLRTSAHKTCPGCGAEKPEFCAPIYTHPLMQRILEQEQ